MIPRSGEEAVLLQFLLCLAVCDLHIWRVCIHSECAFPAMRRLPISALPYICYLLQ